MKKTIDKLDILARLECALESNTSKLHLLKVCCTPMLPIPSFVTYDYDDTYEILKVRKIVGISRFGGHLSWLRYGKNIKKYENEINGEKLEYFLRKIEKNGLDYCGQKLICKDNDPVHLVYIKGLDIYFVEENGSHRVLLAKLFNMNTIYAKINTGVIVD